MKPMTIAIPRESDFNNEVAEALDNTDWYTLTSLQEEYQRWYATGPQWLRETIAQRLRHLRAVLKCRRA